jgi:signal transduction histidine kinase
MSQVHTCKVEGTNGQCWLRSLDEDTDITPQVGWTLFRECLACDYMQNYLGRADGRRTADRVLGQALASTLDQIKHYDDQLRYTGDSLRRKVSELTILNQVSDALARTSDLQRTIELFLVGVTSGGAIGLNRALLFLVDGDALAGTMGLGHISPEEGRRTWLELAEAGSELQLLIDRVFRGDFGTDPELNGRLRAVSIPRNSDSVVALALKERDAHRIDPQTRPLGHPFLEELYDGLPLVAVPLSLEQEPVGVLLADNFVTGMPILDETIALLQTLANQAAAEIVNKRLHADLEQQLAETEHLYELLRENQNYLLQHERLVDMGKLAATVAHEIKTPLVAIGGFARRARKALDTATDRPRRELDIIIREVGRLERITAEILDYSKDVNLNLEPVDLRTTLDDAVEVVETRIAQARIELRRNYSTTPCEVMADARRIKQVILNLLENAIDAMSPVGDSAGGGCLTLSTRSTDTSAIVEFEDTGPGIPEDLFDRVFTPFFTTKEAGSGLGLPVSRRIITDHGGRISLVPRAVGGTRFTIELPKFRAPNAPSA